MEKPKKICVHKDIWKTSSFIISYVKIHTRLQDSYTIIITNNLLIKIFCKRYKVKKKCQYLQRHSIEWLQLIKFDPLIRFLKKKKNKFVLLRLNENFNNNYIMALIKMVPFEEELKKNQELNTTDIDMLKDWLNKQPHLPPMPDSELALFLHSNYYRIEPTKTTIDTFFTVRTHVPEFFTRRDPLASKELRQIMKVVRYVPLPQTTPEGYKIIYSCVVDSDPSHYTFVDALRLYVMFMELSLYISGTGPGHIMLIDMEGTVFGHVARLNPLVMKKFFYYLQEACPIRLKGIHFLNTPSFMDLVLNLIKPFIKKELMDVLFLHNDTKSLSKTIPIDLLPNEQGGKAGPIEDLWSNSIKQIEEHRAWFQEEETRTANESTRPGKAKNVTDLFGVEGSFKKLDID